MLLQRLPTYFSERKALIPILTITKTRVGSKMMAMDMSSTILPRNNKSLLRQTTMLFSSMKTRFKSVLVLINRLEERRLILIHFSTKESSLRKKRTKNLLAMPSHFSGAETGEIRLLKNLKCSRNQINLTTNLTPLPQMKVPVLSLTT